VRGSENWEWYAAQTAIGARINAEKKPKMRRSRNNNESTSELRMARILG